MKPVLNFQIPNGHTSLSNVKTLQSILEKLKDRLSDHYEIVITPFQMQADNMVSITINPDTDINEVLKQLTSPNKVSPYVFHMKYMPTWEYHVRDYDGDETVHPLDMMDDYWLPVIEMVNYTDQDALIVLRALEKLDINPFTVDAIYLHNGSDDYDISYNRLRDMNFIHPRWEYVNNVSDDYEKEINRFKQSDSIINKDDIAREYIRWMIEEVNFSSHSTDEILNEIDQLGTPVFSISKIEDDYETVKFWLYWPMRIDKNYQEKIDTHRTSWNSRTSTDKYSDYINAGYSRRMNREVKKNGTSEHNGTNC